MCVDVGDEVVEGQTLFVVHANDVEDKASAADRVLGAIRLSDAPVEPLPLFYDRIT
jgi:pyrimidine-nucleoside phosphorylase